MPRNSKEAHRHQSFAALLHIVDGLSAMGAAELIESLPPSRCRFTVLGRYEPPIGFDVVCQTHGETIHERREG